MMEGQQTPETRVTPAPRPRSRTAVLILSAVLFFAAGVAVTALVLPKVRLWWSPASTTQTGRLPTVAARLSTAPPSAATQDMLELRVADLDDRLTRINVEAQAAAGNAARAEALLIAFAARRALDSGTPLGYVEAQLRLRFGPAQPRAVATIINASREPVTLVDLEAGLAEIAPELSAEPPTNWWSALLREADGLVTIRRTATPGQTPDRAYERAMRLLETGRVDQALTVVERMPGRARAEAWMQMARRYREAHRALGLIETAAILEPRQIRASTGAAVDQASPLAP
jgi:hypothetical protein